MPFEAARAIWEVTAGLIPGTVDPRHTRRWAITSGEWEDSAERAVLLLTRAGQVAAYAAALELLCADGMEVNWVRIDFVWP